MATVRTSTQVDEKMVIEKEKAFQDFIQRRGLKTTRQRSTIVRTFFQMRGHISVEELLREVKKANPKIGYATVYRTLHLLVESRLVEERRFGDGHELPERTGGHGIRQHRLRAPYGRRTRAHFRSRLPSHEDQPQGRAGNTGG